MTGRARRLLAYAVWTLGLVLVAALSAHAHEGAHGDPELLGHWRAQVHLLFQWAHLVAFGLWVGGIDRRTGAIEQRLEGVRGTRRLQDDRRDRA